MFHFSSRLLVFQVIHFIFLFLVCLLRKGKQFIFQICVFNFYSLIGLERKPFGWDIIHSRSISRLCVRQTTLHNRGGSHPSS